jgi:hypothetical protein
MTRKDMITRLAHMLERCHDRHGNLFGFESVAEELLEEAEAAGMKAPCYKCETSSHDEFDLGEFCDTYWEDEDD